ncbi:MAG: hypothetical protein EOO43_23175 [Flavobacterium sp.]|nr:MAG: hypothetical protein EOO43_23175 [Flavobacterium sp.]
MELGNQDKTVLTIIAKVLRISSKRLTEVYLRVKTANIATDSDLSELFNLQIPIYQAIFLLAKEGVKHNIETHNIGFSDIKLILYSLIEPNGLLYHKMDCIPRTQFSNSEAVEIKNRLKLARNLGRKERQEILSELRVNFRFFPSHFTNSRSKFDDGTFEQLVLKGNILIVS